MRWKAAASTPKPRLALLTLHERSRSWRAAVDVAHKLERSGTGSYASRIAHYWCELALEADARQARPAKPTMRCGAPAKRRRWLRAPLMLAGQRARQRGDHAQALQDWGGLLVAHPAVFALVAVEFADSARQIGQSATALATLSGLVEREPALPLLQALAVLDPGEAAQRQRLREHLRRHPTLSSARALLRLGAQTPPRRSRSGV